MNRKPLPKNKKKGTTKRQHYVPQMILRRFSDDNATTGLIVLKDGRRIERAPFKQQCYGDYFYGDDQVIENSFAASETTVGAYLGDLSKSHLESLSNDDLRRLKVFVHYQLLRTQGAAKSASNFLAEHVRSMVRGTAQLNDNLDVLEGIDDVNIRFKNMQLETTWQAAKTTPVVMDLCVKFLFGTGFIIGDHPVHPVFSKYPATNGLALKGLQLFMPLSPRVTLAVYDPGVYDYGDKDSLFVEATATDVESLNRMQTINALECCFFDRQHAPGEFHTLLQARAVHPCLYEKPVAESQFIRNPDKTISRFVMVAHRGTRIGASFSFVKITDTSPYEGYDEGTLPVRYEGLLWILEFFDNHVEKALAAGRADRQAGLPVDSSQLLRDYDRLYPEWRSSAQRDPNEPLA